MLNRFISSMAVATAITFGLFFVMQALVDNGNEHLTENEAPKIIDMVQVPREIEIKTIDRSVPKPPDVMEPPKTTTPKRPTPNKPTGIPIPNGPTKVADNGGLVITNGPVDGEYLPIMIVQPEYPRKAAERGIEGNVLVEFTVSHLGTVINPTIVEANPPGYFEKAAIKAVLKFKYKPKVLNGAPMAVTGVRNLISFKLQN